MQLFTQAFEVQSASVAYEAITCDCEEVKENPPFVSTVDKESSVYTNVAKALKRRKWKVLTAGKTSSTRINVHLEQLIKNVNWSALGPFHGRPQLVNFYRGAHKLTLKSILCSTLKGYIRELEARSPEDIAPDILPTSFVIMAGECGAAGDPDNVSERAEYLKYVASLPEPIVWIAKASHGAKGNDIKISRDPDTILTYIDEMGSGKKNRAWVVQRYLEQPFLLDGGRKFDIRVWVLLGPNYEIYIAREGVLRTSGHRYSLDNLDDPLVHLTNHCIQEAMSSDFGKFEEGNELFFDDFHQYLKTVHRVSFWDKVWPQICTYSVHCLQAVRPYIEHRSRDYLSFQLFGFDYMLDDQLKLWLLEVNGSPAAAARVSPQLGEDIARLVIFPHVHDDDRHGPDCALKATLARETLFVRVQ